MDFEEPGPRPFSCDLCERSFNYRSSLTSHRRTHTGEMPYQCPICLKKFSQSSTVKEHVKNVHKVIDKPEDGIVYMCTVCKRYFKTLIAMKCHSTYHAKNHASSQRLNKEIPVSLERPNRHIYDCERCNFSTNFHTSMRRHLVSKHNMSASALPVIRVSSLASHHRRQQEDKPYIVVRTNPTAVAGRKTSKSFKQSDTSSSSLSSDKHRGHHKGHSSSNSKENVYDFERENAETIAQDPITQMTETSQTQSDKPSDDTSQLTVETGEVPGTSKSRTGKGRSTQCRLCKKIFKSDVHLKHHIIFCQPLQFTCHICTRAFRLKSLLDKHMQTEHVVKLVQISQSGTVGVACKVCGRRFVDDYQLKVHMRRHTGEKPYECSVCKATFTNSSKLKLHISSHVKANASNKAKKCPHCNAAFTKSYLLAQHIRNIHKVTIDPEKETQNPVEGTSGKSKGTGKQSKRYSVEKLSETLLPNERRDAYVCDICGKTFAKRCYVENHIKKHVHGHNANIAEVVKVRKQKSKEKFTLEPMTKVYETYIKLQSEEKKLLHKEINRQFCLNSESVDASQIPADKTAQSPKYQCKACGTVITHRENLLRHVRNRPFDHVIYFKRRLVPLHTEPLKVSMVGTDVSIETNLESNGTLGTEGLALMKEYINMVLRKIYFSNVPNIAPSSFNERLSKMFDGGCQQFYCDVCGCPYSRRYSLLFHRSKHSDEEFKAAGRKREVQELFVFQRPPNANTHSGTENLPMNSMHSRATMSQTGLSAMTAKAVSAPTATIATATAISGSRDEEAQIYMDTDEADADHISEDLASNEVAYNNDLDNNDAEDANKSTDPENNGYGEAEKVNAAEQLESGEGDTENSTDGTGKKENRSCPLCELIFLENQRTISCHLCGIRFCMQCSQVPRELHSHIEEANLDAATGYVWMCKVCRPLLPRLAVTMKHLGDLEHCLNSRITDLEKRVSGIQQMAGNIKQV